MAPSLSSLPGSKSDAEVRDNGEHLEEANDIEKAKIQETTAAGVPEFGIGPNGEYIPDSEEEKKLLRKIDLFLLPTIWLMYLLSYMDRTK
jgi:hypothetical protein